MNKGANIPTADPQIAGIGERQTPTQEQTIAHTYFAGVANLKCIWVMQPVNQYTQETDKMKGTKNFVHHVDMFFGDALAPGLGAFK